MSFLFVDRISDMEPGKFARGLKHVSPSDLYLYKNQDNNIALYSCIIGEAIGQLCSWNVMQATQFQRRLIGGVVGEVAVKREPLLGETVLLENTIETLDTDNNVCHFHGIAKVGSETIIELKDGLGPIMPVADFSALDTVKQQYAAIYQPGELPQIQEGQNLSYVEVTTCTVLNYDRLLAFSAKEKLVAQKNISITAPYFKDHFPDRPVMPVTLMVQSNLLLGQKFLSDSFEAAKYFKPLNILRVKMNEFVPPGAVIETEVKLKSYANNKACLALFSRCDGKRVCTFQAEFEVVI